MKKYISIIFIIIVLVGLIFLIFQFYKNKDTGSSIVPIPYSTEETEITTNEEVAPINNLENKKSMQATLNTSLGTIKIEFYDKDAPKTVENFKKLANDKFYDGVKFHRVIKGFMIQGGDPLSKDDSKINIWGSGGPGYKFADEINAKSDLYAKVGYQKGIVAMANSGPNTNGSQFFIMHANYPLPPLYTIFGKVISGQEVVDKIANVQTGANDRPVEAVVINSITVN